MRRSVGRSVRRSVAHTHTRTHPIPTHRHSLSVSPHWRPRCRPRGRARMDWGVAQLTCTHSCRSLMSAPCLGCGNVRLQPSECCGVATCTLIAAMHNGEPSLQELLHFRWRMRTVAPLGRSVGAPVGSAGLALPVGRSVGRSFGRSFKLWVGRSVAMPEAACIPRGGPRGRSRMDWGYAMSSRSLGAF